MKGGGGGKAIRGQRIEGGGFIEADRDEIVCVGVAHVIAGDRTAATSFWRARASNETLRGGGRIPWSKTWGGVGLR